MLLHLIEQRLQIFTLIQGVKMSFMSDENCFSLTQLPWAQTSSWSWVPENAPHWNGARQGGHALTGADSRASLVVIQPPPNHQARI